MSISLPVDSVAGNLRRHAAGAWRVITKFFDAETDARNLASFRIVVFAVLFWVSYRSTPLEFVRLPTELRVAPPLYGAWVERVPFDVKLLTVARRVLLAASLSGAVGLFSRSSALIACLSAIWVLGVSHCFGKVNHTDHHLVWFTALLAASPAGDAWSVDAWRKGNFAGTAGQRSIAYALPIRIAWLLVGIAYFFPGVAKLVAGPEWVFSDNVKFLLYRFWSDKSFLPWPRIDRWPGACQAAALVTIVFEIGFLPSLFFRKVRPLATLSAISFHAAMWLFLQIQFFALMACYPMFIDWAAILDRIVKRPPKSIVNAPCGRLGRSARPVAAVGAVVVGMELLCGVLGIDSWPFACYPRFNGVVREAVAARVEVEIRDPSGIRRLVGMPSARRKVAERVLAMPDGDQRSTAIRGLEKVAADCVRHLRPDETMSLVVVTRSTLPEDWKTPPLNVSPIDAARR